MTTPFIRQCDKPSDELKSKMKISISKINISQPTIGSTNGQDLLDKNKTNGYQDTLFNKILESKIEQDYKTIKDGLDLLNFYLNYNKDINEFNFDIMVLHKAIKNT